MEVTTSGAQREGDADHVGADQQTEGQYAESEDMDDLMAAMIGAISQAEREAATIHGPEEGQQEA